MALAKRKLRSGGGGEYEASSMTMDRCAEKTANPLWTGQCSMICVCRSCAAHPLSTTHYRDRYKITAPTQPPSSLIGSAQGASLVSTSTMRALTIGEVDRQHQEYVSTLGSLLVKEYKQT